MLRLFLTATTIVCGVGWLSNNIAVGGLVQYMADKNYTPPTKEELRACIRRVARRKFSLYA